MEYDPNIHHRRSIRLQEYDYAQAGYYFVTICTQNRRPLFGTIANGRMALNDAGRIAAECWRKIPEHFPSTVIDEWIIMPDHVHGVIRIVGANVGANNHSPTSRMAKQHLPPALVAKQHLPPANARANDYSPLRKHPHGTSRTLGSMVRGFKIGVTKIMGDSPWQRNYYEIIARTDSALKNIRAYIRNNPANWDVMRYGEPCFSIGNRELLDLPKTAFLASRGGVMDCDMSGRLAELFSSQTGCVISGFLSPMEQAVFRQCIETGTPMIQVLARGLQRPMSSDVRRAVDAGRLLIITPFKETVTCFSAARAAWCNQYVLDAAGDVIVACLKQDGMLACLLADMRNDTSVQIFSHA